MSRGRKGVWDRENGQESHVPHPCEMRPYQSRGQPSPITRTLVTNEVHVCPLSWEEAILWDLVRSAQWCDTEVYVPRRGVLGHCVGGGWLKQ